MVEQKKYVLTGDGKLAFFVSYDGTWVVLIGECHW